MTEFDDMPGRSITVSTSRLWTFNAKKVGGTLRGPFCASIVGVPKLWVDELFCMGGDLIREKAAP